MEDESIASNMLSVTLSDAKKAIKDQRFLQMLYNNDAVGSRLTKAQFLKFAQLTTLTEQEASEFFAF